MDAPKYFDRHTWLTVREVSDLLRTSRSTLLRLVRLNQIPHVRVLRSIRFHRPTLEAWMASGGTAADAGHAAAAVVSDSQDNARPNDGRVRPRADR